MAFCLPAGAQDTPVTGTWNLNANGNWSAAANWTGGIIPGLTTNPTFGIDDVANLTNNISANRTITIDGAVPGTNVVLGTLNMGDPSGGSSFTLTGGTLTFDVSAGSAQLNMLDGGGNLTISSLIQLNDTLNVRISDISNNQGISLSGKISGGTAGTDTIVFDDLSTGVSQNWLILNAAAGNTFEGRLVVNSGLLRYDGANSISYAGATGVGNETVINDGGAVDLRDHDFNVAGDSTEIFHLTGKGAFGLGAMRNTSGTGIVSHVILDGDTFIASQGSILLDRRLNTAGDDGIAPILDLGGHTLTKIGTGDFYMRGVDLQNTAGAVINIYEGEIRFEERGALTGGASGFNNLDGLTFNLSYNRNPYDNADPANGSRTTNDLYNVIANQSVLQGNSVVQPRLSLGVYWGASVTGTGTLAEQTRAIITNDNVTINLNNGVIQREGNGEAGRTFDQIWGPNTTFNLVGGGIGRDANGSGNLFDINGGSGVYNSTIGAYDNPGAMEIQGQIDNTTGGNAGTGFTVRGSRELRLTGDNANFNGDVLVKLPTYRWIGPNYNVADGAMESTYTNMSLGGANGTLRNAHSITLTRMGSLALLNNSASTVYASANNNDRLNDDGFLNLRNGVLKLETDVSVTNTENMGHVVSDMGTNFIYLETRAGGAYDGAFEGFTRNNSSVLKIIDTNVNHTFGSNPGDDRIAIVDSSGIQTIGADAPGTPTQRVVPGIFGGTLPTLAAGTGAAAQRSVTAAENAAAFYSVGLGLMTLDGGFLRPLTPSEYSAGTSPVADSNWLVNGYIGTETQYVANRDLYPLRNILSDTTVNSLTIAFDPVASGQAIVVPVTNVDTSKEYVIMDTAASLTIKSGIINFATVVQSTNANVTAVIRGGSLNMDGQQALINSTLAWEDLDTNSGSATSIIVGNNAYIRSHIVNATGLVKTGRNSLYLETSNEISGNIYVSDSGSLVLRHPDALGAPAASGDPVREVVVAGTGNLLLEYGTNIKGLNIRATNTMDTTHLVLRNEGTTHSTWTGDVIIDGADAFGAASEAAYTITARNNGTLTLYGNIYTDNNANYTDDDSFADPPVITTSIGETFTLNLRGQMRDVATGNLGTANPGITSVYRTGDSATRLDANHSLRFQLTGHDEGNVNVYQQWDATGRVDVRQGYFRVMYDPTVSGVNGFYTDSARALLAGANEYFGRFVIGADGTSTTANYHSHLMLTRDGQVFNAPYLYSYNDNRQGTQTIGGENDSGTVYFGSINNDVNFSLQYTNQQSERDIRFLQVRGGNMVFNGRLDDENGTVDSFNAVATIVGPGTITFNVNAIGTSDIDRWNFMGGTTHWGKMTGNNQFARTAGTNGSRVGFGGGNLILDAQTAARTQTLDGNIYLMAGASSITTNQNATLTLGGATRVLQRASSSSLAFLEDGNGAINFSATGLSTTDGAFLGTWGVYGTPATGITDWAARQSTTGVKAFAGYSNDTFGSGNHVNLTTGAILATSESADTLRFAAGATLDVGLGNTLTLDQGGILIPATVTDDVQITGGSITSGWTAGDNDLMIYNYGQGRTSVMSVIANNGGTPVNLVVSGTGTTALQADNTFTGDHYLNGGVLEISSESQLGDINGSVARLSRVSNGGSNGVSLPAGTPFVVSGGGAGSGFSATFQTDGAQTVNTTTNLVSGGSGYTSGLYLNTKADFTGTAAVWAILDSGNLHFNGGELKVTDDVSLDGGRTIFLGANGGTLDVASGSTLTINGYITSELSQASPANGYTTINHLGVADEQASNRNPDIGDLIIQGGGTVTLTGAPDGTVRANMYNSYGGITWLNEGILRISSAGSSSLAILGTNRSWVDGTVIGDQGTLLFNATSDISMPEWITFRGQGYQSRGTIQTVGTARTDRLQGQLFLEENVVINNKNGSNIRFNEGGGSMYGSGSVLRLGNGTLQFYGNEPDWTGSIVNASGDMYVTSVGNLPSVPSMTLERTSILYLEEGSTSINEFRDRLNDDMTINTDGYVRLRMRPTGGVFSGEEKVGAVNVLGGQLGIEFDIGTDLPASGLRQQGDYGFWHFDSIVRSPGTTVQFRALDPGVDFATSAFGDTQFGNTVGVIVDNVPTMSGSGDGLTGNAPVAVGMFGSARPLWVNLAGTGNLFPEGYMPSRLMTTDTTALGDTILRPLQDTEYKVVENPNTALTTSVDLNAEGLTGDQNLKVVGVTTDTGIGSGELTDRRNSLLRLGSSATVNSLTLASESFVDGSATGRGNYTAFTIAAGAELTINSGMVVSANIGIQDRHGITHNANNNLDLRNAINGGALNFNGGDAIFNLVDLWVHYNTAESPNVYQATDGDNALLYLNSSIVNAVNFTKTGATSLFMQSPNFYTGDTYVNEGIIYVRNDKALGTGNYVNIQGAGGLVVGQGVKIEGKTIVIGKINGGNLGLVFQEGASWAGDVIIDNVDSVGGASYNRSYTPRIYNDQAYRGVMLGDIYGGSTPIGGIGLTEPRMFSAYDTGTDGLFEFRGRIRDTATGTITGPLDDNTINQVLRMEIISDNNGYNVALFQPHEAAGRIRLIQGILVYQGNGDFYAPDAAAVVNSNLLNPRLGFQMGGRGVISGDGDTAGDNLSFMLANPGSIFNLATWEVGVETNDPENLSGNDNYGRGNTTGNSTLGGLNRSGETVFGLGTGSIIFTQSTRQTSAYTRDLRLLALEGGEVSIDASLVDSGSLVNSSITKIGRGQVNLHGSSAGAGSIEAVNVMGGVLLFGDYDVNAARRVASGADLLLGGGVLAIDGSTALSSFSEDFGAFSIRTGGSAIAAVGPATTVTISGAPVRAAGGQVHFQTIAGGTIHLGGVAANSMIGSYATFGAAFDDNPLATDWAATDASGNVVAFAGYATDTFAPGSQTDVVGADLAASATDTVRFNSATGTITSGSLTLNGGGILITSAYAGGTPVGAGVGVTTASSGTDLIIHNYSSGAVEFAGDISGSQKVVFNGTGATTLTGTNTYTGITYITGAASVMVDSLSRFGSTASYNLNGGELNFSPSTSATETLTSNLMLGGNDGIIRIGDAGSRLILRGTATAQISSEANVISAYNSNPFSGGLTILGPGTVQFGNRSAGTTAQDLLGVSNDYTGLTILGDGVTPVRVDIQAQGNDNAQYTPFGTTESWADGTIIRDGVTLEFSSKRGDSSRDNQIRFREWFQIGENASDTITFDGTTQRQPTIDGQMNIIGTLVVYSRAGGYADAGGTGNSEFLFNPNEGGITGTGDIVKMGDGNLRFYQPVREWTGNLDIRDGFVGVQSYQTSFFENTGKIIFGDPNGVDTTSLQMRIEPRYGNNSTQLDSGTQTIEIARDIMVRDNIKQAIRISVGYGPEAFYTFSGNIYVGAGSTGDGGVNSPSHVRFYNEDTTGMDGYLTGHSQRVTINVAGDLSGTNNVMLDANEGGSANDDPNDQFTTFMFSGDNAGFTGKLTVGPEQGTGTGNFDRDDLEVFRFGSDTALSSGNTVEMRNLSTMQLGGHTGDIGSLITNDGASTTGLYSFSGPTWDTGRQTTADLTPVNVSFDATTGTLHGGTGTLNYTPLGGSSAIIENASSTPGTLRITQNSNVTWDAFFRDGVPDQYLEPGATTAGSLSIEKLGTGAATMSIYNTYTGTTTVQEGVLQVGVGGDGEWALMAQGGTGAFTATSGGLKAVGSTGTGNTIVSTNGTLTGSGHVRGNLDVYGTLSPGDAHTTLGQGAETGTLFVGGTPGVGNLTMRAGSTLIMQAAAATTSDSDLNLGNYTIEMGTVYEDYVSTLLDNYSGTSVAPNSFGETGTGIVAKTQHDHLELSGGIIWQGGDLQMTPTASFAPNPGDLYNLIDWYGITLWSGFDVGSDRYLVGNGDDNGNLDLPDLSAYDPTLRWDTGLWESNGVLIIAIVPEPSRMLLLGLGLFALVMRRRRVA